jgi:hypothetical protein
MRGKISEGDHEKDCLGATSPVKEIIVSVVFSRDGEAVELLH